MGHLFQWTVKLPDWLYYIIYIYHIWSSSQFLERKIGKIWNNDSKPAARNWNGRLCPASLCELTPVAESYMAKPFFWLPLSTYHSSGLTEGVSSISKADKVCWNLNSFHPSKSCPMWSFHACSAAKPAKPSSTGEMSLHFYCPCALTWHQQISVAQIPVKKTAVSHDDPWIVLIPVHPKTSPHPEPFVLLFPAIQSALTLVILQLKKNLPLVQQKPLRVPSNHPF